MRSAFTLVELLVVITIIVVLLALLMPALGSAMYQASLAMCGSKLHVTQVGITSYAFDHKRFYPKRKMLAHGTDVDPIKITGANAAVDYDDRVPIKNHIQLTKSMVCPLQDPIDLEIDPAEDTFVYTGHAFWWGWRFAPQGLPRQGMDKIGDRMEFDVDPGPAAQIKSSSVIAADHLSTRREPNATFFYSTHPEKRRRQIQYYGQRGDNPWASGLPGVATGSYVTISWWVTVYAPSPTFDVNYIMAEGSMVPVRDFRAGDHQSHNLVAMPTFKNEYDRFDPINPVPSN
jgi:prepilin-type N-terminal cleavage/methylation domain-containing protein